MNETQFETQGEIARLKKELLLAQTQLRALIEQSSSVPDASERKRTGESLRASEANMAAAQRIAHFGSWELDLSDSSNTDVNALRWSDEMFRIAGYEPGAVEVSNELFFRLVHPDDHEAIHQAVAKAIRQRQPYSIVHRLIRPDGDERVVQEMAQIFCDDETGQPLKIVGTAHDITERKRAEKELHWKTAFLEAQANSSIDGILVVDPQDRMILQNQRFVDLLKIPGHIMDEKDDENRLRWVTDMTRDPVQFVKKVLYLYAHRDETSRDEIELKDGTILDRYSAPVVGHDGSYYGRIWTFRDI
ncbi:MAG: PAS domain-containing protein, partial [Opitutaceae bacterium]|nr:PAS domain-containing protein [Verrucomicrobiales bacterium]